jgi:hypothetical protein
MSAAEGRESRADRTSGPGATSVSFSTADGASIIVRVFPEDRRLADDVRRAVRAATPRERSPEDARTSLESTLRAWYPRLRIRPREDLPSLSEAEHVWYVMRDGRVHAPEPRLDRLHAAMANARDVQSEAAEVLTRTRELVGVLAGDTATRRRGRGDADAGDPRGDGED